MIDPFTMRITETLAVSDAFRKAERDLGVQLDRLGQDDAKWALIKHLALRFEQLKARHDGLQVMVERAFQREFAIEEIRLMTVEKRCLTAEIEKIMDELEGVTQ